MTTMTREHVKSDQLGDLGGGDPGGAAVQGRGESHPPLFPKASGLIWGYSV
jgi:hypothetical protein